MKTWIVYCARHRDTGRVYVGQTHRKFEQRREEHCYQAARGKLKLFHAALVKYGIAAFDWEVLESDITSVDVADQREVAWIEKLHAHVSMGGFNLTKGGQGSSGFSHTEESRKKIGDRFRGIPKSPEQRAKMGAAISAARKGKKLGPRNLTPEQRERMSAAQRGKKRTGGWKHNAHAREKQSLNSPLCKSVTAVSTVDGSERKFRSQTEAGKSLGLSSLLISECCRGLRKEAGGYYWRFTNDSDASSGSGVSSNENAGRT